MNRNEYDLLKSAMAILEKEGYRDVHGGTIARLFFDARSRIEVALAAPNILQEESGDPPVHDIKISVTCKQCGSLMRAFNDSEFAWVENKNTVIVSLYCENCGGFDDTFILRFANNSVGVELPKESMGSSSLIVDLTKKADQCTDAKHVGPFSTTPDGDKKCDACGEEW